MVDISTEIAEIEAASRGEEVRDSIVSAFNKVAEKTFDADSTPTEDSENVVTSDGIYTALAGKQDTLTFDSAPTDSSTNPVTSGGVYTALADKQDAVTYGSLSLTTTWTSEGNDLYSQAVTIAEATSASKIDLQPDATVLAQMLSDKTTALWVENDAGTVTVYAMGVAPTVALTVQYSRTEVAT